MLLLCLFLSSVFVTPIETRKRPAGLTACCRENQTLRRVLERRKEVYSGVYNLKRGQTHALKTILTSQHRQRVVYEGEGKQDKKIKGRRLKVLSVQMTTVCSHKDLRTGEGPYDTHGPVCVILVFVILVLCRPGFTVDGQRIS